MIEQGATIIDIGGESTRPNASPVELEEEIRRVIPVVKALSKHDVIMSIDTSQPDVIRAAVKAGAHIWNDVRALTRPMALETAAELNIPVVLMHMRGEPTNMNQLDQYENVPYPDRNWYALVAYNMGPGAVNQIQKRIKAQGKNPNQWVNLYDYLQRNQARNGRYKQALQYVTRIRTYLEHLKTSNRIEV